MGPLLVTELVEVTKTPDHLNYVEVVGWVGLQVKAAWKGGFFSHTKNTEGGKRGGGDSW
jgi:archaellum component FlaD/FlaE